MVSGGRRFREKQYESVSPLNHTPSVGSGRPRGGMEIMGSHLLYDGNNPRYSRARAHIIPLLNELSRFTLAEIKRFRVFMLPVTATVQRYGLKIFAASFAGIICGAVVPKMGRPRRKTPKTEQTSHFLGRLRRYGVMFERISL